LSYFESREFKGLAPRTQSDYQKYIAHILDIWGDKDPRLVERHNVYQLHAANADRWRAADYLVQVLVVLFKHASYSGILKKDQENPARGIPLFKTGQGDGWEPWPDDAREEFERIATPRARLVYELCIGSGQRIGDVLEMRWSDLQDGALKIKQGKTDKPLYLALTARLKAVLDATPRTGKTIITGTDGISAASYFAVTNEMLEVRRKMKHPAADKCVTHGLRKNATIEFYLSGADDEMVKAVTGHSGVEMLKKYGGMIRQRELAKRAQAARDVAAERGVI